MRRVVCDWTRARRTMDHRRAVDEDRITMLETMLRETSEAATECERKYEEVCIISAMLTPYGTFLNF